MSPPSSKKRRLEVSLADLVTLANAVCGFLAIAVAARLWTGDTGGGGRLSEHAVVLAGGLIVLGALLDSVDGAVARWRGGSALGEHLELMSDVVTFGLAPSILFAVDAASYSGAWPEISLAVAAGYAVAVLLRLARYASAAVEGEQPVLVGLPSPPSAMAAVSLVVLHLPAPLALAGMAVLSVLMLASFPFPRIVAATAPLMTGWWALGGVAAVGLIPTWPVAAFTLVAISGLLLVVPLRRARLGRGARAGVTP
jgi:CDP-diacylglycerol--serine O-phosphatidyltransferase